MEEVQPAGTETWCDEWPQYECRTIEHFAPIPCSECDTPTQQFYYVEIYSDRNISYEWHGMCIACERVRNESLRGLYE